VRLETLRRHARPADAGELHLRTLALEGRDQMGGEEISRGLAGHHTDAQVSRPPSLPVPFSPHVLSG